MNSIYYLLFVRRYNTDSIQGTLTKFQKRVGWTINKFWLSNSLSINSTILTFSYQKRRKDVQRRMFASCSSYHQIIAVWILVSEGRDKKGGFVETISKRKMQVMFKSGFASHWIEKQNKNQTIWLIFPPIR